MPKCPKCGSAMIEKSGRYGKFFGCVNFPKCEKRPGSENTNNLKVEIDKEIHETKKKKYTLFLSLVNKVWKLEKEKVLQRDGLKNVINKISAAHKANGIGDAYDGCITAELDTLKKRKETLEKNIENISEKQREQLREIEKYIIF